MQSAPPKLGPVTVNEAKLILTAGLIQFVNVIDFMMVMPLGPDFSFDLHIPLSDIGMIAGAYAFAASIAGLIASFFVDHYPRKKVLLFFLAGLSLATLGGAIAWNKESLLAARVMAGLFGGPLGALSLALVSDYIPPERRGAAMGKVMGAFSIASILGLPFGLELSRLISWHAPFVTTGILGFCVLLFAIWSLPYHPPFQGPVTLKRRVAMMLALIRTKIVLASFVLIIVAICATFIFIPHITAHLQLDWHYPRAKLGWLYFTGGLITFFSMRGAGRLIDKTSASFVSLLATALFVPAMMLGFVYYPNSLPVLLIYVILMVSMTTRTICTQALFSKIPQPQYRGAYNAMQASLTHFTQAVAAYASSFIVVEQAGQLLHIARLGWIAIILSLVIPVLFYAIEKRLGKAH